MSITTTAPSEPTERIDMRAPAGKPAADEAPIESRAASRVSGRAESRDPSDPGPATSRVPFGISPVALVAGALAAVTAALLGSQLGVAGTLVGAAVSSVVATSAGAAYTAGLQRTHDGLRVIARRRRVDSQDVDVAPDALGVHDTADAAPTATAALARPARTPIPRGTIGAWAVAALATFTLALVLITGFELGTGRTLSGESGTSVGRVAVRTEAAPPASDPEVEPVAVASAPPTAAATNPSAAPTPSTEEPSPSVTPSASTTPGPTATSTATSAPTSATSAPTQAETPASTTPTQTGA